MRLTPFVAKALKYLSKLERAPASWVAGHLWDDGQQHHNRRWLRCAQGLLGKMKKRGLVETNTDWTTTTLWSITSEGRRALREAAR